MLGVSIIGDSISTFRGYNPEGYAVFYDEEMQRANGLKSVYDTWWAKVNQQLHAYLCVNNSYSGSRVSGKGFPAAFSEKRISELSSGEYSPDVILIYIGFNDFANGVESEYGGTHIPWRRDTAYFDEAYTAMISNIKDKYPWAKIVCATLARTKIKGCRKWVFNEYWGGVNFERYNSAIRFACKMENCYLADIGALDIRYETLDGGHPTAAGHETLYKAWMKCINKIPGLREPSIESCIRLFRSNENDEVAFTKVIHSLINETVLMPYDASGQLISLTVNGKRMIPLFTSPAMTGSIERIVLRPGHIRDKIDLLNKNGLDLIVNPFSDERERFVIPHAGIENIIRPVMLAEWRERRKSIFDAMF